MHPGGLGAFHRQNVVDQAAAALRQALREGALIDPLPGEIALSRQLGISRPSLRAALARLAEEGWLQIEQGRRTRVAPLGAAPPPLPRVCVLCPHARSTPTLAEHPLLLELHAQLASHGVPWEEVFDAKLAVDRPDRQLQRLTTGRRGVCWVLLSSTTAMQTWFSESGLPAVVLGSSPPGVDLPSIDLNYRAVGWHAAGHLVGLGHRRIALILPERRLPGDEACRLGFRDYVSQRALDATLVELGIGKTPPELRHKLARLLRSEPRPTALFCMRTSHTVTTLSHLLGAGYQIPRDLSLISRDSTSLLDEALPEICRYSTPARTLAARAARLIERRMAAGTVAARLYLVIPRFVAGSSTAAPAR